MTTEQIVKTSNRYTPLNRGVIPETARNQTQAHYKTQHNQHHQERIPTKLQDVSAIQTIVNGQIPVSRNNKLSTTKTVKTKNYGSTTQHNKTHKILITGESHVRNCAANVKSNIRDNPKVQGVVKAGAGADILVTSVKREIKSLSKNYVVVFCGGANDVGRNNSS